MTALIPLGTLRSLLALNTLPTNQGPAYRPATQRDTFSLSLLHAYCNKPYFVVLLKEVLLFICVALKNIVLGKLIISRNAKYCFMQLFKEIQFLPLGSLFLSHVQVFLCEILLVCHLKCPYNCYSSPFCF